MPTSLAELISDRMVCPTGRDDSRATDRDLLDRVVPLWLSDCGTRPSLRFGSALLSNKSASGCTGRWQLHLFTFATEARLAQQTMALIAVNRRAKLTPYRLPKLTPPLHRRDQGLSRRN